MAEVDPFAIVQPKTEALAWLPFGAARPAGWRRDLEAGFVSRLDQLVPALIQADDLYGRARLTRHAGIHLLHGQELRRRRPLAYRCYRPISHRPA